MQFLELTWWELIALVGLAQSVYLLVYMVLRAGRISNASLALACFSCLTLAFLADFGGRFLNGVEIYPLGQDLLWYAIPVLSVLLCLQIVKIEGFPEGKYLSLLLLIPFMAVGAWAMGSIQEECSLTALCDIEYRREVLGIVGIIIGGMSLLVLWIGRGALDNLAKEKTLKSDRYWLILALIIMNCALICNSLSYVSGWIGISDMLLIRNVLGCGLVYLASTSLFRIYPQTLRVSPKLPNEFNVEESGLVKKLEELIGLQKVYQEPGFSRADLARELATSESTVTRLVNAHFGRSVPQLLNEKRIADARQLLEQTDAPVSVVAEQVGFNSLPSFNRVFKEITGQSPSEYRDSAKGARKLKA